MPNLFVFDGLLTPNDPNEEETKKLYNDYQQHIKEYEEMPEDERYSNTLDPLSVHTEQLLKTTEAILRRNIHDDVKSAFSTSIQAMANLYIDDFVCGILSNEDYDSLLDEFKKIVLLSKERQHLQRQTKLELKLKPVKYNGTIKSLEAEIDQAIKRGDDQLSISLLEEDLNTARLAWLREIDSRIEIIRRFTPVICLEHLEDSLTDRSLNAEEFMRRCLIEVVAIKNYKQETGRRSCKQALSEIAQKTLEYKDKIVEAYNNEQDMSSLAQDAFTDVADSVHKAEEPGKNFSVIQKLEEKLRAFDTIDNLSFDELKYQFSQHVANVLRIRNTRLLSKSEELKRLLKNFKSEKKFLCSEYSSITNIRADIEKLCKKSNKLKREINALDKKINNLPHWDSRGRNGLSIKINHSRLKLQEVDHAYKANLDQFKKNNEEFQANVRKYYQGHAMSKEIWDWIGNEINKIFDRCRDDRDLPEIHMEELYRELKYFIQEFIQKHLKHANNVIKSDNECWKNMSEQLDKMD